MSVGPQQVFSGRSPTGHTRPYGTSANDDCHSLGLAKSAAYYIVAKLPVQAVLQVFPFTFLGFSLNLCGMFAIISDVHSNLEALTTVLADIERRGIKTIYCLGDVVGYGPNPKECLDLIIERTKWCVLGNHDYAVFYEPTNFNYGAEQASFWTRGVLENEQESPSRNRHWSFLGDLPMMICQ
jgi:hypothetical protein